MHIVMYEFVVAPGKEAQFLTAWPKVTQGIYLLKGSLGSRLHKTDAGQWIAYAQWPDRATFEKSAEIDMDGNYQAHYSAMRDALDLESTRIIYQMDVESDYFQQRPFAID